MLQVILEELEMKSLRLIIITMLCVVFILDAKEGWYKVEVPTKSNIRNISFCNKDFGIALTNKKEMFVTLDGGNNFINKSNSFPLIDGNYYYNIVVNKPNDIYIYAYKNIFVSKDTCKSWDKIIPTNNNGDTLTCTKFFVNNDICYCFYFTSINFSKFNLFSWQILDSIKYPLDSTQYYSYSRFISFLNQNEFTFITEKKYYNTGTLEYYYEYYNDTNKISIDNFGQVFDSLNIYNSHIYPNVCKLPNKDLLINTEQGLYSSKDSGKTWKKYLEDNKNYYEMYQINNDSYFMTLGNRIGHLKNKIITNCIVDTNIAKVKYIYTINDKVAFTLLDTNKDNPTTYFLKTEDGGGVDLSDVEEVIPQDELSLSTHIELYDILGRSIATFTSYEKLKAEIENYPPPHLLKWRDEKGIFHFEKVK